jgi:hypothetical protein
MPCPHFASVEARMILCYNENGNADSCPNDYHKGGELITQAIRVTCPYCKSSAYITAPPPQTILMGPCPICSEPVALYDGKVIGLKEKMASHGGSLENIQSLARTVLEFINSQSDSADGHEIKGSNEKRGRRMRDSITKMSPSIRNPIASPITDEEVEDFLKIDLNLLGKKDFFDKHLR